MNYASIVYRRGIEIRPSGASWILSNPVGTEAQTFASTPEATSAIGHPPICPMWIVGGGPSPLLLNVRTNAVVGVEITDLQQGAFHPGVFSHVRRMQQAAAAMMYHCSQMAKAYVESCRQAARIKDPAHQDVPRFHFANQEEPYFELHAFLMAARRAYFSPMALLWSAFEKKGNAPREMEGLLSRSLGMPPELRAQLEASWTGHGVHAKNYRDTTAHYDPIEFGHSTLNVEKHRLGIWTARAFIPDNPAVRRHRDFTFMRELDALDYSLDLVAEVVALLTAIKVAVTTHQSSRFAAGSAASS